MQTVKVSDITTNNNNGANLGSTFFLKHGLEMNLNFCEDWTIPYSIGTRVSLSSNKGANRGSTLH